ncbi:hypothetical protein SAMN05660462_00463 [Proteiniborus ethanoligenes]|uniref:Nucleotidyl transferase AbiEii toxin, Type IV TA system n=1 Tax=Proteiniborus ethanoligenes TaxID=415015 RepID=A0A1H3LAV5_9FIRM|nr:hypothetical protein [Proteiniborus ethanoligenes]SDY61573.1 hypothetical protein SAMN05660462_00463 [Proteiniborus ethanoligenes]
MFNTLSQIGQSFDEEHILWGVGASIMLNHYGLADKPNDIDILVGIDDIKKVDAILKSVGEKKIYEKTDTYSTEYFYEYVINDFDVDVMAGFKINYCDGIFEYIFDKDSISEMKIINGVQIPLTSLEDWYVIYQLIPNREAKVEIIENYLLLNGIKNPNLLERLLKANLPKRVRENIIKILSNRR